LNNQEAYKKLDLARGLNIERIKAQYNQLKSDIESKISSTQNERLKQVYVNRLNEIEEAYSFLVDQFASEKKDSTEPINPTQNKPKILIEGFSENNKSPKKNNKTAIILSIAIGIVLIGGMFFINLDVFKAKEEIDFFRKIDGEKQIFVNNLTLRQYPDSESSKIEVFPFSTRLIIDENEPPKTDHKNRTWRKVRVIHPIYGWEKPDERFPYPYEGWMALDQCNIPWVEDSLQIAKLSEILGNEDAGSTISSNHRHALIDYFEQMNYYDNWVIYGLNKKEKLQNILSIYSGNSDVDCNGDKQNDLIILLKNKTSQKHNILVLSTYSNGQSRVIFDENQLGYGENKNIKGMRKLTNSELKRFNRSYNLSAISAIYIDGGDDNILVIINGEVVKGYWGDI